MTGVTQAGPAHPALMAAIHAAAFPAGEAWNTAVMAAQMGLPGVFGFIAAPGGMILARAVADEAEILTLAVAPEARRQGIGRRLVRAAANEARRRGACRLLLDVSAANSAAHALYISLGFTEVGHRSRYYADGSDALLMALRLDTP